MLSQPKYILLFAFVFVCKSIVLSQEGNPFITHFRESKELEGQNWSICQDKQNVMLFANRRGIMSFDGQGWQITKVPYIPFALKKSPFDEKVYVGANNNYGYLERNTKGSYEYISLVSDSVSLGVISKIVFTDSSIFFYSDKAISRHSRKHPKNIKRWHAEENRPFTGMFVTTKNTFINVAREGLYRLENDSLFPIATGFYTKESEILFSLPYSNKRVLVGTDKSELYTFDGVKFYNYNINDDGYLKESILADGQIISDSLYAFGTLLGGVEIVNKKTGKIVFTINYQNGLPDDEIYSLGLDNNNGLWLSHEFGVSRVDFEIPIRNYTSYPGIKGNLISSVWHNNELYIATNEGVYYLSEVKDYNEVSIWVKTNPKQITTKTSNSKSAKSNEPAKEPAAKRSVKRRLFSGLFSKNVQEPKAEEKTEVKSEKTPKSIKKKVEPKYIKKTISKLKAINHIYKKVEGIDEKCSQLVSTENGILVASNNGLFHIENHKATVIADNKYINQISDKTIINNYVIATNDNLFSITYTDSKWEIENNYIAFSEPIYTINILYNNVAWLGGDDFIYSFVIDSMGMPNDFRSYKIETDFPEKYKLDFINDTLTLFLESGVYYYDYYGDAFKPYKESYFKSESTTKYILDQKGLPWIKKQNNWINLNNSNIWDKQELAYLKLFENITSIISDNKNNLWIIDNNNQVLKIIHEKHKILSPNFNVFFNTITNEQEMFFELSGIVFDAGNKTVNVNIIAPYYIKKNSTYYQFFVKDLMNNWSKWTTDQDINLIVESGTYNLEVRAKDSWGNISEIKSIKFTIKAPFTESILFYILIGIGVTILFFVILKIRNRKLIYDKKILEQKVKERTVQIQNQKEEIETQRDEILFQRDEIYKQKDEITDSINYASRIQNAILPMEEKFEKAFSEHFIFFRPRDIISGDFYWIAKDDEKIYFTAADCTGHGVPGAFMSMLGITSLNEIFRNEKNLTADRVLTLLRNKIKLSLHQTGKEGETKDGIDMAFCIFHKDKNLLEYAGAYNPLYLIRNGEIQEYKADKMPIGIYHVEKKQFTNHEIKVQKGDVIYIFSDGYVDQFGGPKQYKFKSSNLKLMLLEIYTKPMKEQKKIMEENFENWKGDLDQIDDIIFIGVRL